MKISIKEYVEWKSQLKYDNINTMPCLRCSKEWKGKIWKACYVVVYDKCRGKNCPDCGKVRRVGAYKAIFNQNPHYLGSCVKCKREAGHWIDGICVRCFIERERKRGCCCFCDSDYDEKKGYHNNINYHCPLCDELHPCREALCKKCFEGQASAYQRKPENIMGEAEIAPNDTNELKNLEGQAEKGKSQNFPEVVLLTIISLIIGFCLWWLFFKKLRKERKIVKKK